MSNRAGCAPLVASFTDSSTGGPITRWHWQFDSLSPADTANVPNPNWIYSLPGSYNVKLVVWNAAGMADSITVISAVTVTPQPVVRFTASDTVLSCAPQTISFTNMSDTGGCSPVYSWYIDSAIIHTTDAVYTFTRPGRYNITLSETDACGCTGYLTKTAYIKIDSLPALCYHAADTALCSAPVSVCFTNCSVRGVHYTWYFGDGHTDTVRNPCHTYTAAGTYTDSLVATSLAGCRASLVKVNDINIGTFTVAFGVTPGYSVCVGQAVTAHDSTFGGTRHLWRFSSSPADTSTRTAPVHTYTAAGTFTIKDSVWNTSGCAGVGTHTIVVNPPPSVSFTADNTYRCTPADTVTFTPVVAPGAAAYSWYFGDPPSGTADTSSAASPVHIFTAYGHYTPRLTVTDSAGCTATDTMRNYINIGAVAGTLAVSIDSGCVPVAVSYTNILLPAAGYITDSVTYGDGSPHGTGPSGTHTYTASGYYDIIHYFHVVAGGCHYSDTAHIRAGVHPVYAPHIYPDSVCPRTNVYFNGNCTNCTSETWYTGAGTFYTDTCTTMYLTYSLKPVVYVAVNSGCADTTRDTVYVYEPNATFTPMVPNCSDRHTFHFLNTSTGASGYHWDFGDGSTSDGISPVHTYSADGTYLVRLTDTGADVHRCTNFDTISVHIYPFPTAFFANDSFVCKSQLITFRAPATPWGPLYSSYTWLFGDGGTAYSTTADTATHRYGAFGSYTVRLALVNQYGCPDTITRPNYITVEGPRFHAVPTYGCAPLTVHFTDSSEYITGVPVVSRHWSWNAGTPLFRGYSADTVHTYAVGAYHAVLIDTDANGCAGNDTLLITAVDVHAYFTSADTLACTDVPVHFTDTNTHASYTWYFGDGSAPGSGMTATHTYAADGTYNDTVIITTLAGGALPAGCMDTFVRSAYIHISNSSITPAFTLAGDTDVSCPNAIVSSSALSTAGYYYRWKNGLDSTTITGAMSSNTYTYTYPGNYTITLIDSSAAGCKDSLKKHIHVGGPTGYITLSSDSLCAPGTVLLHLTATSATALDTVYDWSVPPFGAYITDTPGVQVTYPAGVWNPYVIIQSAGCRVTVHTPDSVHVYPVPAVMVTHADTICRYDTVRLTATGAATYAWYPAAGLACATCGSVTARPLYSTTYTIVGTSVYGCSDTAATVITVLPIAPVTISGSDSICAGRCDTLHASGTGDMYMWSGPALSAATGSSTTACPAAAGSYTVIATDSLGCHDTASFHITVISPAGLLTIPTDSACLPGSAALHVTATGPWPLDPLYDWILPPYGAVITDTPGLVHTYSVAGAWRPSVIIYSHGCPDTLHTADSIHVYSPPVVSVNSPGVICRFLLDTLMATGAVTYTWSPAAGLSCTNCADPVASPASITTYTVTGRSIHGCIDTATATVAIDILARPAVHGRDSVCPGQCDTLYATSVSGTYRWVGDALSCTACTRAVACPAFSQAYSFIVTDSLGCSDTAAQLVTVNPLPIITFASAYVCQGSTAQLSARGADTYVWSPAAGLSCTSCADPVAAIADSTTYMVTGTSQYGCVSQATVVVPVIDSVPTTISSDTTICVGQNAQLTATGSGSTFIWTNANTLNDATISNPVATPTDTTTYAVTIHENKCFSPVRYVTVNVVPVPQVTIPEVSTVIAGTQVQLQAAVTNVDTPFSYLWKPAGTLSCATCADPLALASDSLTTYTVTVTTPQGCSSDASVTLRQICDNSQIFVPNTFTPNGDGNNDRFYVSGKGINLIKRMTIYDRWGEQVFSRESIHVNLPEDGWDGTFHGRVVAPDVFVYIIDAFCELGQPYHITGNISVVR